MSASYDVTATSLGLEISRRLLSKLTSPILMRISSLGLSVSGAAWLALRSMEISTLPARLPELILALLLTSSANTLPFSPRMQMTMPPFWYMVTTGF